MQLCEAEIRRTALYERKIKKAILYSRINGNRRAQPMADKYPATVMRPDFFCKNKNEV